MAYNAATAVYDCAEVMNYNLEVKVKMAAQQTVDGSGKATDDWHTPPRSVQMYDPSQRDGKCYT